MQAITCSPPVATRVPEVVDFHGNHLDFSCAGSLTVLDAKFHRLQLACYFRLQLSLSQPETQVFPSTMFLMMLVRAACRPTAVSHAHSSHLTGIDGTKFSQNNLLDDPSSIQYLRWHDSYSDLDQRHLIMGHFCRLRTKTYG